MRISILFTFGILFLAGCQTAGQGVGSGPITLSSDVKIGFQNYLAREDGSYFAVSTDGKVYGYSYCPHGAYNCSESGGTIALRTCQNGSRGVPCKIYAIDDKVVWKGAGQTGATGKIKVETGRGPISLSARTETAFKAYLDRDNPQAFAVTEDGKGYGYSFCNNPPCLFPDYKPNAVTRCEAATNGRRCYIYAVKRKVVWQ